MSEDDSGKRRDSAPPVIGSAEAQSSPLASSRATPTDLLRKLVGSRPPMPVRFDEPKPVSTPDGAEPALDPIALAALPTEVALARPGESDSPSLTSAPPAPVLEPGAPSRPAHLTAIGLGPLSSDRARGRPAPSDAPFASSLFARPMSSFRPSNGLIAFAASLCVGIVLVLLFRPSQGALVVTAGGPRNAPLASARVELDGQTVCANVPCRIESVAEGEHRLRVQALGYRVAQERSVSVPGGGELASHFTLEPAATATLEVNVDAPGLRIYVDGQDRGPAPGRVTGLAATPHLVELLDNTLFAPFEQRVELRGGDVLRVEPTLTLLRGAIVLRRGKGAKDANVFLIRDGERRIVPKLPARVEVAPLGIYRVVATRRGFPDFERTVSFSIARPEVTVVVELSHAEGELADAEFFVDATAELAFDEAPSATPSAPSILSIESTPSCNVVLDGRPIGKSPQTLPVAPGSHSVVFVHPELGRKSVSVKAEAGKPSAASVRF
jgi:hypothetical protein